MLVCIPNILLSGYVALDISERYYIIIHYDSQFFTVFLVYTVT